MPENTPQDKQIEARELLKQELTDKIVDGFDDLDSKAKQFIFKKLLANTPIPRSSSYYHEKYALQLIEDVRMMMADEKKRTLFYAYEDYPQWSHTTLRLYLTNAFGYIVQYMDDKEKTFGRFRAQVEIDTTRPDGIRIKWKDAKPNYKLRGRFLSEEEDKEPEPVEEDVKLTTAAPSWRKALWEFMENAVKEGETFTIPNDEIKELVLTKDEIEELTNLFETNEIFGAAISKNKILVRKVQ